MKYVCLVYLVEKDMNAMPKEESDTCTDESLACDDALRKAGHLVVAHALQPVESATTIRVRNGRLSATDGPFAETKEQLLGFYLVDCASLEFIDSSGIHVLLSVRQLLEAHNREFRIENLTGTPRRAFELLGLFDCVDIGEPEPA